MVTRSTDDYDKHCADVYGEIRLKYGEDRAQKFIDLYKSRWDKYQRSYLDYKFAWVLTDDYYKVKGLGTKWYAIVGPGGTGKSTLAANMFYFLDHTLDASRANITDVEAFIKKLHSFEKIGSMKAVFMDEPEDKLTSQSKKGKILRAVLGKARQQQLFLGFLATDLKDIPTYIFRKLDGIVFLPRHGVGLYFKNQPTKYSYPLQRIRMNYDRMGYNTFFLLRTELGCLTFSTHKGIIYNEKLYQEYLKRKKDDYTKTIQSLLDEMSGKNKKAQKSAVNPSAVVKLQEEGKTHKEIAEYFGVTRRRIGQILREVGQTLGNKGKEARGV